LGPGLLATVYEECVAYELQLRGPYIERQVALPLHYKGVQRDCGYRLDLFVEKQIMVELKATDILLPIHRAQLLTYLKLNRCRLGLLVNFNTPVLKDGIERLINRL
jgi:GxxExxY protein